MTSHSARRTDRPWFEHADFWEAVRPFMLGPVLWQSASAEARLACALLDLHPPGRILDLCSGPGRHSIELARMGFRVTAVDRTASFLSELSARAREAAVDIKVVEADMRDYREEGAFDAVLNMYTSFGYSTSDDDELVLRNVHASLDSGGGVLIDLLGKEVFARNPMHRTWWERNDETWLFEREAYAHGSRIRNRWICLAGTKRTEHATDHRLFAASELVELMERVGFERVRSYGNFDGAPYDSQAMRLIVSAQR